MSNGVVSKTIRDEAEGRIVNPIPIFDMFWIGNFQKEMCIQYCLTIKTELARSRSRARIDKLIRGIL